MPEFPQLGSGRDKTQPQAVWSQSLASYPQQIRAPWVARLSYHCLLQLTSNCLRAFLGAWNSFCLGANSPYSRSSSPPKADGNWFKNSIAYLWWDDSTVCSTASP